MGDCIEREAIKKRLDRIVAVNNLRTDRAWFTPDGVKALIEEIPAADVRPVVRGRWEEWWPGDCALIMTGEEMLWMCSECTAKFSDRSAYCPNCGADMRTGEWDAVGFSIEEIENAPTIIPAEEGQ